MKIVFASSRTASNKRKICQQKIDFDINASTNKLQLLSGNILITLNDHFVCIFSDTLFTPEMVRYCDYSQAWDRVASLSCLSVRSLSSSFSVHYSLLVSDFRKGNFIQGKTDWSRDKIGICLKISQERDFLLHTDDSMVQKNSKNQKFENSKLERFVIHYTFLACSQY